MRLSSDTSRPLYDWLDIGLEARRPPPPRLLQAAPLGPAALDRGTDARWDDVAWHDVHLFWFVRHPGTPRAATANITWLENIIMMYLPGYAVDSVWLLLL